MESVGSSDSPPPPHRRFLRRYKPPAQALAERISRAFRHRLLLLHRSDSTFFVMGSTGNVYAVVLTTAPTCTCPDRLTPCKHILFVLIRVLGVPPNDPSLLLHYRRTLRPCQVARLLATPESPDCLAASALRHRFLQMLKKSGSPAPEERRVVIDDGACCPVCLEELTGGGGEKLVACVTCRNPVHEDCLIRWKRTQGRRRASCVICRARWRNQTAAADKYLNLAAYLSEQEGPAAVEGVAADDGSGCGNG